nr:hypothetical protein [Tanacetum cinerariifolium]
QFWSTAVAKTINGEEQIHAMVDGQKVIISEAYIRRDLQFADEEGVDCLPNSTIFEQHASMSTVASAIICLATNQKFNFSKLIFNSMDEAVYKELDDNLVRAVTTASSLKAEQDSSNIDKTQSKATPNESSSQGTDSGGGPSAKKPWGILLLKLDLGVEEVFVEQEVIADKEKINEVTLAQVLKELKTSKPKAKGVVIQELSESPTTTTTIPKQKSQDKGKGIKVEEPVKHKQKDQIRLDEEAALKLQAKLMKNKDLQERKLKKN